VSAGPYRARPALRRAGSLACLLLAVGSSPGAASGQPPGGREPAIEEASRALESGAAAEAERLFRRVLVSSPDDVEALVGWARSLATQGRAEQAATGLLRAGERALRRGDGAAAAALLAEGAALAPERGDLRARLGQALLLDQRHAAAEEALRAAVRLGSGDPATRLQLAAALWENGRLDEAEERYREAAREAPDWPVPWFQLGRFLAWQGRWAEAVESLERAVALGLDGLDVLLARAQALDGAHGAGAGAGATGELASRAVDAWTALVARAPDDSYARYGRARALRAAGDSDGARRELAAYRELYLRDQERTRDAGLARARLESAREELRAGRPETALERLRTLDESADVLEVRASAELELGRPDDAARSLERAVTLDRERRDLRERLDQLRLARPPPA
jgi:Flp pilus assembly protein TadD